jgi:hypothetical protein
MTAGAAELGKVHTVTEHVRRREITETLIAIYGPRFCAGVVARDGRVIQAAPIVALHIRKGMDGAQVAATCKVKGWTWEVVSRTTARMMG